MRHTNSKIIPVSIHEEILAQTLQKQNHRGLGYETNIPAYRKNPVNPIPKHIEIPTDEEISYKDL